MRLTALAKLWRNNSLVNLLGKDFFYRYIKYLSYCHMLDFRWQYFVLFSSWFAVPSSWPTCSIFYVSLDLSSASMYSLFFFSISSIQEKVVSVHCIFLVSDAHIILYLYQRFLFVFSFFYPPASLAYLFISVVSAKHRTVFPSPLFHLVVCYFALLFASLKGKAQASYIGYLYCFHEIFFWVSIPTRSFLTVNMQLVINGRARTSLLVISFSCIKRNGRGTL